MITVSVKRLMDSITEANEFSMPDMNNGTKYLYDSLYTSLASGRGVSATDLDYNRFTIDDIGTLESMYTDVIENNAYKGSELSRSLMGIEPASLPAKFV